MFSASIAFMSINLIKFQNYWTRAILKTIDANLQRSAYRVYAPSGSLNDTKRTSIRRTQRRERRVARFYSRHHALSVC